MFSCESTYKKEHIDEFVKSLKELEETQVSTLVDAYVSKYFENDIQAINYLKAALKQAEIPYSPAYTEESDDRQLSDLYSRWEIGNNMKVISVFGANVNLRNYVSARFTKLATKYCLIDTDSNAVGGHLIVDSTEILKYNIALLKNDLARQLINRLGLKHLDYTGLASPNSPEIRIFDHQFGADSILYKQLMEQAYKIFERNGQAPFIPSTFEMDASTLAEKLKAAKDADTFFLIFALNNFDTLMLETLPGLVRVDSKRSGDLQNVNYEFLSESEATDVMGVTDQEWENSLNQIPIDVKLILASIPKVTVNRSRRTIASSESITATLPSLKQEMLQIGDVLRLASWFKTYDDKFEQLFNLNLDWQKQPQETLYSVLKAIHDNLLYDKQTSKMWNPKLWAERRKFIYNLGPLNLETAMALYEYLYNDLEDRVLKGTRAVKSIIHDYRRAGRPVRVNIESMLLGIFTDNDAPMFIEHLLNGTVLDNNKNLEDALVISKNLFIHQKGLDSSSTGNFQGVLRTSLMAYAKADDSIILNDLKSVVDKTKKGATFNNLKKDPAFKNVIRRIFSIQATDNELDLLESINEEESVLTPKSPGAIFKILELYQKVLLTLKQSKNTGIELFREIGGKITGTDSVLDGVVFSELAPLVSILYGVSAIPTFKDRLGNSMGVYRTTSMVFMIKHIMKHYKEDTSGRGQGIDPWDLLKSRCNILCHFPQLVSAEGNSNYKSTIAIPLTMGDEATNLEARKVPAFTASAKQFLTEFFSLMNSTDNKGKRTPMSAVQIHAYSDKGTLPELVLNMVALLSGRSMEELLEEPAEIVKIDWMHRATNQIDLVDHVLSTWASTLNNVNRTITLKIDELQQQILTTQDSEIKQQLEAQVKSLQETLKKFPKFDYREDIIKRLNEGRDPEILKEEGLLDIRERIRYSLSHITSFSDALLNKFISMSSSDFLKDIEVMGKILLEKALELEGILRLLSKSDLQNIINQQASPFDPIVDTLFCAQYKYQAKPGDKVQKVYMLNQMMLEDLKTLTMPAEDKRSSFEKFLDLQIKREGEEVGKVGKYIHEKFIVNGKEIEFIDYLINCIKGDSFLIMKSLTDSKTTSGHKLFKGLIKSNGDVDREKLEGLMTSWLVLQNMTRHAALELTVKEAYEDPYKSGKLGEPAEEKAAKEKGTTKRNNTFTASVLNFKGGMIDGINTRNSDFDDTLNMRMGTAITIIDDLPGGVFNTIGLDREVDEYDGAGFTHPIQARMESRSLNQRNHTTAKKTFVTIIDDYYAGELKWASYEITNKLIRESKGCAIDLENVFKRMSNKKFEAGTDLTKFFRNNGNQLVNLLILAGRPIYVREGFKYYKLGFMMSAGNNLYKISRIEVDRHGKEILSADPNQKALPITVTIENIYDLWKSLGGINTMELVGDTLTLETEIVMDLLYEFAVNVGNVDNRDSVTTIGYNLNNVYLPLRNSFIGILATKSADKRGLTNVISNKAWTDSSIPFAHTYIDLEHGGKLLDADHGADGSTMTESTLLILQMGQRGFTEKEVMSLYEAIALVMQQSSVGFNNMSKWLAEGDLDSIALHISKLIIQNADLDGLNYELSSLIGLLTKEANGGPVMLPLSLLISEALKTNSTVSKNIIKRKDTGLMGVMNPSSGFLQLYHLGGQQYLRSNLESVDFIEELPNADIIKAGIENVVALTGEDFNEVLFTLSAYARFNDKNYQWVTSFEQAGDAEILIKLLLHTRKVLAKGIITDPQTEEDKQQNEDFNELIQDAKENGISWNLVRVDQKGDIEPSKVYITSSGEKITVEAGQKVLSLLQEDTIYYDMFTPIDLQAQVHTVETVDELGEVYRENEYTCFEAQLGYIINDLSSGEDANKQALTELKELGREQQLTCGKI